jgi:integrase
VAHIQKRNGRWQAAYRGPDHRERTKTFRTKIEAEQWLATQVAAMAGGGWVDPSAGKVTLEAFAWKWLEQRTDLAVRTAELYRWLLKRHVLPALGKRSLAALAPSDVRTWHAALAEDHPTTAAKAYRLLSQIMRTAVADEKIHRNPCQVKGAAVERAPERPMSSIVEVQQLAEAMPARLRTAVLLAAWCQLRRAELLGLRRKDIDLSAGTVSIEVTRTKAMNGTVIVKAPKSDAGRRVTAIPSVILRDVRGHLAAHVGAEGDALLFPVADQTLSAAWVKARIACGRPGLRLHDMRHAGLTWTAIAGATTAELMHRAGHASATAALRYQHATADRDRALAEALAGLAHSPDLADISRTSDDESTSVVRKIRPDQGAADRDRTGMISLEG